MTDRPGRVLGYQRAPAQPLPSMAVRREHEADLAQEICRKIMVAATEGYGYVNADQDCDCGAVDVHVTLTAPEKAYLRSLRPDESDA